MKAFQKILGAVMAATMMAMSFAAYAETTEPATEAVVETTVMPRGTQCPSCGKMTLTYYEYNKKTENLYLTCTHGAATGRDVFQITTFMYYYDCRSCSFKTDPQKGQKDTLLFCPNRKK